MLLKRKINITLCFSFFSLFLFSCKKDFVFEKSSVIPNSLWNKDNIISFEAKIDDTVHFHNVYLFISTKNTYNFSNLYMFIAVETPGGRSLRDTSQFYLMDATGKWYGKKHGDEYLNKVLYKRNVIFQKPGIYKFKIVQAMRQDNIDVSSVGLIIEKYKK